MRPHRLSRNRSALTLLFVVGLASAAVAADYKIEPFKQSAPATLAGAVRESLQTDGYRIVDEGGQVYAEFWLRKAVPAAEKPAGAKGAILYPFLSVGELLGALRFPEQGRDNRDQAIPRGVYTLRYGLQPVNGDHLGVSPHRDFALLLPAAKDTAVADVAKKPLEQKSAESAGASHPAILMLVTPKPGAPVPSLVHDEQKDTWGAVVPLRLEVKGGAGRVTQNVQIVIIGVFGS